MANKSAAAAAVNVLIEPDVMVRISSHRDWVDHITTQYSALFVHVRADGAFVMQDEALLILRVRNAQAEERVRRSVRR
jgi:hypothetical protein